MTAHDPEDWVSPFFPAEASQTTPSDAEPNAPTSNEGRCAMTQVDFGSPRGPRPLDKDGSLLATQPTSVSSDNSLRPPSTSGYFSDGTDRTVHEGMDIDTGQPGSGSESSSTASLLGSGHSSDSGQPSNLGQSTSPDHIPMGAIEPQCLSSKPRKSERFISFKGKILRRAPTYQLYTGPIDLHIVTEAGISGDPGITISLGKEVRSSTDKEKWQNFTIAVPWKPPRTCR